MATTFLAASRTVRLLSPSSATQTDPPNRADSVAGVGGDGCGASDTAEQLARTTPSTVAATAVRSSILMKVPIPVRRAGWRIDIGRPMMINGARIKRPYDCDIRFVDPTSGEPLGEQTLELSAMLAAGCGGPVARQSNIGCRNDRHDHCHQNQHHHHADGYPTTPAPAVPHIQWSPSLHRRHTPCVHPPCSASVGYQSVSGLGHMVPAVAISEAERDLPATTRDVLAALIHHED